MANTMVEMVSAVREYAATHYGEDGWDTVVECYDIQDLIREISEGKCMTIQEAIDYVGKGCKIYADHEKDVRAEIF